MVKLNYYPKTYGRKKGRRKNFSLSTYKNFIQEYSITDNIFKKKIIIEIGSGNGENVLHLSQNNKNKTIIACEVYIDGNMSLIKNLRNNNIKNVKIFEKHCLILIEKIPKQSIDQYWILYPDPWPKKRHNKRKLINNYFLKLLNYTLKNEGKIYIATDDKNYFLDILIKVYESKFFKWNNDNPISWIRPFNNMIKTNYYMKAQKKGQKSNFIVLTKNI